MKLAPIAFFAYNRPRHALSSLVSLADNALAQESTLYLFCDGPKNEDDFRNVRRVRDVVRKKKWCRRVHVVERSENVGLARSIVSGVDELCDAYGKVIVIEDDLVLSPRFLTFMNEALEKYRDASRVMHVSGYCWPLRDRIPDAFFLGITNSWGWGTWKRAWQHFDFDAESLIAKVAQRKKAFNLKDSRPFFGMLKKQALNIGAESWAVRWYASVFIKGGLALFPGLSYVQNIGMDGSGTNCASTQSYDTTLYHGSIVLPDKISENRAVRKRLIKYFRRMNRQKRHISFWRQSENNIKGAE